MVVHLASYGVAQHDRDTEDVIEGNVNLVSRLLLATADWPLRKWLHTGSCFEYGPAPRDNRLNEQNPVAPATIYGAAKASSVLFGAALAQRIRAPFCTLRLFGVYGPGEAETRLIPSLFQRLSRNQAIDLTAGEQVRDLLYIDDAVDAYLAAIDVENLTSYQVYNVCSGEPVTIRQVGTSVASAMGKPSDLLCWGALPYRPDEPPRLVGDPSKFTRATLWRPTRSLAAGVAESVSHLTSTAPRSSLQSA